MKVTDEGEEDCVEILKKIQEHGERNSSQAAFIGGGEMLTYGQIEEYSSRLAGWLLDTYPGERGPIVVYGHKNPYMIVCFLACVKAGRAYCPVDISVPASRVGDMIQRVPSSVLFSVEELPLSVPECLPLEEIEAISRGYKRKAEEGEWVRGGDVFYIIFTSGSTGTPKGVEITYDCLNHYLDWAVDLGSPRREKEGKVFLNQAPFSFDLSVMDLYTCLACGGTLYTLDKKIQGDYAVLLEKLKESHAAVWVSTPSFADICLADSKFCSALMEKLEIFLFCGEILTNHTAEALLERFPDTKVVNTYGPTESTVAVTDVEITRQVAECEIPLPVGRAKPGTRIEIRKQDGTKTEDGERGEIVIIGDTVSSGYYKQPELTRKAFFQDENGERGYCTGDEGYLKDGMLYYGGRMDSQVKLHGYRIELGDIESNLLNVPGVRQAVVIPRWEEEKVKSLAAFLAFDPDDTMQGKKTFQISQEIKRELKKYLPEYMIPKKMVFLDQIPVNRNGKADRAYLKGLLG